MIDPVWVATIEANAQKLRAAMQNKIADRILAKWQRAGDVDWEDIDFYIGQCKFRPSKDNFDTALAILDALKDQVLNRK
jgi:hypothetical protein